MTDEPRSAKSAEERIAALEARIENLPWWRNPGWWSVIVAAMLVLFTVVSQTKAWELFEQQRPSPKPAVKLIEAHADAYAKDQWSASLRVLNDTPRNVVVERVIAVFGKASYGQSCNNSGNATQVLYPVSELHTGHPVDAFQAIPPGGGAPFEGSPNLDVVFAGKRCPLAIAKLQVPQDPVTYSVFTDNGSVWRLTSTLFYQPRARVGGAGGGGLCLPFLPFC